MALRRAARQVQTAQSRRVGPDCSSSIARCVRWGLLCIGGSATRGCVSGGAIVGSAGGGVRGNRGLGEGLNLGLVRKRVERIARKRQEGIGNLRSAACRWSVSSGGWWLYGSVRRRPSAMKRDPSLASVGQVEAVRSRLKHRRGKSSTPQEPPRTQHLGVGCHEDINVGAVGNGWRRRLRAACYCTVRPRALFIGEPAALHSQN
jgi:hypothetical protein